MNKLLLSATGMIAMTTAFTAAQSAKPQNINNPAAKPNILVILADDMRADSLGVINPYIKTPNLDRLCNQGVRFNNCYIMGGHSAAVCTASRVMLMSGRSRFNLPNDIEGGGNQPSVPVMSTVFKAAGYDTFYCGKHGNTYRPADKSFDKFKPINVQLMAVDEPLEPELARRRPYAGYITEYLAEPARKDKPSFIFFAPSIPHDPIVPEPEDLAYYTGDKLPPLPKSAATEHAAIAGFNLRDTNVRPFNVPGVGNLNAPLDLSQWRGIIARHYAYITGLDRHVGRILDELERTGADKNTIVVFSADNGHSLSDLGLIHKNSAYDQDLKVPLIIRGPGIPAGKTSDALVYLSDLFPTLCQQIHIPIPDSVETKSFQPVLADPAKPHRTNLYSSYTQEMRCYRDGQYKIILFSNGKTRLFDLQNDPFEMKDLSKDPAQAKRVAAMTAAARQAALELKDNPATSPFWKKFGSGTYVPEAGSTAEIQGEVTGDVTVDAKLPNVLIIGDSISIGYTPGVRALLKGKANVFRPKGNCLGTTEGVSKIDEWLAGRKWDVIHFNWGLHDLKHVKRSGTSENSKNPNDPVQATVEQYGKNLEIIVGKLKATGAKLIFATTTPVVPGTDNPLREPDAPARYNAAAINIMKANKIHVNDLFAFCTPQLTKIQQPKNVHFKPNGSKTLAKQVADAILVELPPPPPK